MKHARLLVVVLVAVVLLSAGAVWRARHANAGLPPRAPADVRAPDSARVRVEVLNGTKTRGLARRAMIVLRDRGFDVLETGTESVGTDTTIVYDLTGHADWARRVARIFPPARVVTRPDSSRYLDVAVVVGSTWRPPAEPFHP